MAWWNFVHGKRHAKIKPSREMGERGKEEKRSSNISMKPVLKMKFVSYQTMIKRYGSQRHPRLDSYELLKSSKDRIQWL